MLLCLRVRQKKVLKLTLVVFDIASAYVSGSQEKHTFCSYTWLGVTVTSLPYTAWRADDLFYLSLFSWYSGLYRAFEWEQKTEDRRSETKSFSVIPKSGGLARDL